MLPGQYKSSLVSCHFIVQRYYLSVNEMSQPLISLLTLTLLGVIQSCASVVYYIKLNGSDCWLAESDVQPCLTLSEFAAIDTKNVSTTLILLPGNHSLLVNLSLSNIKILEIHSNDSNTQIKCTTSSRFSFESIERVSIRRLNFTGCGNNLVKNVTKFFIQETTFNGHVNTGTSVALMNTTAEVVDCTFVGNQFGTIMESVESIRTLTVDTYWLIIRNVSGVILAGGALISTCSNVSITNTSFENNSADIGGVTYMQKTAQFPFTTPILRRSVLSLLVKSQHLEGRYIHIKVPF